MNVNGKERGKPMNGNDVRGLFVFYFAKLLFRHCHVYMWKSFSWNVLTKAQLGLCQEKPQKNIRNQQLLPLHWSWQPRMLQYVSWKHTETKASEPIERKRSQQTTVSAVYKSIRSLFALIESQNWTKRNWAKSTSGLLNGHFKSRSNSFFDHSSDGEFWALLYEFMWPINNPLIYSALFFGFKQRQHFSKKNRDYSIFYPLFVSSRDNSFYRDWECYSL